MASESGLTTWALSPSASFSRGGRCDASRLERGGPGAPKPAARPASSESGGGAEEEEEEGTSSVRLRSSSCGSFIVSSPRRSGHSSQDQTGGRFRDTILG